MVKAKNQFPACVHTLQYSVHGHILWWSNVKVGGGGGGGGGLQRAQTGCTRPFFPCKM